MIGLRGRKKNEDSMQLVLDSNSFGSDFDDPPSVSIQPSIPISTSDFPSHIPDMNIYVFITYKGKTPMTSEMEKEAKRKKKEEMICRSKPTKVLRMSTPPSRTSIDDLNLTDELLAEAMQLQEEWDVIKRKKEEADQKEKQEATEKDQDSSCELVDAQDAFEEEKKDLPDECSLIFHELFHGLFLPKKLFSITFNGVALMSFKIV
ncbi:hypothetical protein L6452_27234 [Arctium lappa]|uniref:Uncharacterized protein n=1 Tax=Arctium lappa TaxID=4217 RepID=A0ACB9A0D0_ARCLA|nr:hypothetical protein L6452_27234 [Arctium lappa]